MSGLSGVWAELGIEPTSDIRKIKKAYARQAAIYHPEEQPEKFQQVYQAYEAALKLAKRESQIESEVHELPLSEEEKQWRAAEKINALTEMYAGEEERRQIRSQLYDCFLMDIVLDKLDAFVHACKTQSHEDWDRYLQDSLFLEAVHKEGFLLRLINKIRRLKFLPETIEMVKEVLEREASGELKEQKKLRRMLEEKVQSTHKERLRKKVKAAMGAVFACVLVLLVFSGIQNGRERERLEELRSPENIEAYINEKYQISSDVSRSSSIGLYGEMLLKGDRDTDYFEVDTLGNEGVPESFHLAWDKSSAEYGDIQDDLEYETVKLYASTFELSLDNLQVFCNSSDRSAHLLR